ncbi:MAG: electron transfer flavoprotein subunit alpha/FixB family protein [Propioniciclava sp.]
MKAKKAVIFGENVGAYPELCAGAAALADDVVALVVGSVEDAQRVAELGVAVRHLPRSADDVLDDYWPALCLQVEELEPQLVLLRSTIRVRALAGRLAVATGLPVASDVAALAAGDEEIDFRVVRYGGATEQECSAPAVISLVGPGLFAPAAPAAGGAVTVVDAEVQPGAVRLVSRAPRAEESVDLTAADVVVGVGRGIGSEENVAIAAAAAASIGAELACSRPVAEGLGWVAKSRYLGVSGAVIQPQVYLALGISGQVQHMVGVKSARSIVAVNKDPKAPIFAQCDLGLVADIDTVLPALTDALG